ncbi:efflux RND transporter periplasmic adaptor subunit [Pseudohalioglobus sediminis]|uniref:Efflux RND transporter periplasmic adaptor subunit n=1 Tax=Pseudohalioglobus sediminis TaxID=2606449 RepID=A0A5B0WYB1_9GAMM|nr:efflux RND transporter periplasmic adaptor subunit [Pseudohalioglobus sediminis]KAA1192020.1 efflux RND transporter periplasmic adaptor subunit [Pseudohalioglobus sediminis]
MKKILLPLAAIVLLLLMVAGMAGYFSDKIEPGLAEPQATSTEQAVAVVRRSAPSTESVPASIEAKEATMISSRLLARITSIKVRAGDYVEEGQLLLELEQSDLNARAEQAREQVRVVEARLREAQQNLKRAQELHQRGLIAVADRDAARADATALAAELSSARRALEEAEASVAFSEIRSPIAGRVVDRFAEPGDTASPGSKLLSLYNPFSLWVEARVREQLALSLQMGQTLTVEVPALEKRLTARIEEIVPAADPGSRSFLIKAVLPGEKDLLPGMYARLLVPAGERERLLVPADRVVEVGQLDVVWVAEGGAPVRRFVRLGRSAEDGMVEVVSGLSEGDLVLPVP